MNSYRNTLYFNVQIIAPHGLAFIGRNTNRNIIMDNSKSTHCVVVVEIVFEKLILLPKGGLNMAYIKYTQGDLNMDILWGSAQQSTLSVPQQNFYQE